MVRKLFECKVCSLFFVLLFFCCFSGQLFGQKYGNALGVRLADGNTYRSVGITFQQRLLKNITVEGILQSDFRNNTLFQGMIEHHIPIITKRLNYYMGTGLTLGNEQSTYKNELTGNTVTSYGNATFGANLIAGLEITLLKYTISIDYKPNFNIAGREKWIQGEVGISARAVIMNGAAFDKRLRIKKREKRREARIKRHNDRLEYVKSNQKNKQSND